jgi:type VI secretion system protein ImpE
MARQTIWHEDGTDRWTGEGQRVLVTDQGDHDLLAIRTIEFADDA